MAVESLAEQAPPGLKHRLTLRGHRDRISRLAWSADGRLIATPSADMTIGVWEAATGRRLRSLEGHVDNVTSAAWSPDGQLLATSSDDALVMLWDVEAGALVRALTGHAGGVYSAAFSPDGKLLASASTDQTLRLWEAATGKPLSVLQGHTDGLYAVAWAPDGQTLASASEDRTLRLWDVKTGELIRVLRGHGAWVNAVAWAPDGRRLLSASGDSTLRLWEAATGRQINVLEGHTTVVDYGLFSPDGLFIVSRSRDDTVRLWRGDSLEVVATLEEPTSGWLPGLAFHPMEPLLATLGEGDHVVRIWETDAERLIGVAPLVGSVHYTNAKVVLVGDTGVGKSGLGLVLCGHPFQPTESTHGRRVWTFETREVDLTGGLKETRETLLWDLAGQPGYRLIHQLHLNEVAAALIVFDARSEVDPFSGVRHWDRALRQARRVQGEAAPPMRKFLVAARADRGGVGVSKPRIETLLRELQFDGYFETSAKEGWNIDPLAQSIRTGIEWPALPRVSSTQLFQSIKGFLVRAKEGGWLLTTVEELYRAYLSEPDAPPETADLRAQFRTCVGRVESRGLIRTLSFGELVLLQPELLDAYASALVNAAKDEPEGMGTISEEDARLGRFRMPEDERLREKQMEILLLIATVEDLLRHEIALREIAEDGPHLVFPSQLTRESPDLPDPEGKELIFAFEGPVLNVYATLAVRLSHSGLFQRKEMWKNAAVYRAKTGGECGMFLRETGEGRGELTLFFDSAASEETRFQFEEYVQAHLARRALPESLRRRRIFSCPECGEALTDRQAQRRLKRGLKKVHCPVCEREISLMDRKERLVSLPPSAVFDMDRAADAQREFDTMLVSAAAEMRTRSFRAWAGSTTTTLAIVFTDIVDFTALSYELGAETMKRALRAHFERARYLIEQHQGFQIKSMGDGLMVAFRTAVQALDFTEGLQANSGDDRVRVRAGLHVGPVDIIEEDAFGMTVNFAARLLGLSKGAEIWVSDECRHHITLAGVARHAHLKWKVHEGVHLKGFGGAHRLWTVHAELVQRGSIVDRTKEDAKRQLETKIDEGAFDVFLCHAVADKPAVREIARRLRERGLRPWLDEWELRQGEAWASLLENQIDQVQAAAVCVGAEGTGPWKRQEIEQLLRQFQDRGKPIVPVVLPGAPARPPLPFFLREAAWVDFREKDPEPLKALIDRLPRPR